jgi:protein involved in polysaccharide export with SLBB domain
MRKFVLAFILIIFTSVCLFPSGTLAVIQYRLAPGDELDIMILDKPELNTKQVIGPNGKISLPLVPDRITVANLTLNEAQESIKAELGKHLHNPNIVVNLIPRSIYVVQHFLKTDTVVYKQATTIEEAKAYAGPHYTKEIHYGDVINVDIGEVPSWWDNNWVAIIATTAVVVGIVINIKLSNR